MLSLFKFGLVDSLLCYFFNENNTSFYIVEKFIFWSELNTKCIPRSEKLICTNFEIKEILVEHFAPDNKTNNILLHHIILKSKYSHFTFKVKQNGSLH